MQLVPALPPLCRRVARQPLGSVLGVLPPALSLTQAVANSLSRLATAHQHHHDQHGAAAPAPQDGGGADARLQRMLGDLLDARLVLPLAQLMEQACQHLLPQGPPEPSQGTQAGALLAAALRLLAACVPLFLHDATARPATQQQQQPQGVVGEGLRRLTAVALTLLERQQALVPAAVGGGGSGGVEEPVLPEWAGLVAVAAPAGEAAAALRRQQEQGSDDDDDDDEDMGEGLAEGGEGLQGAGAAAETAGERRARREREWRELAEREREACLAGAGMLLWLGVARPSALPAAGAAPGGRGWGSVAPGPCRLCALRALGRASLAVVRSQARREESHAALRAAVQLAGSCSGALRQQLQGTPQPAAGAAVGGVGGCAACAAAAAAEARAATQGEEEREGQKWGGWAHWVATGEGEREGEAGGVVARAVDAAWAAVQPWLVVAGAGGGGSGGGGADAAPASQQQEEAEGGVEGVALLAAPQLLSVLRVLCINVVHSPGEELRSLAFTCVRHGGLLQGSLLQRSESENVCCVRILCTPAVAQVAQRVPHGAAAPPALRRPGGPAGRAVPRAGGAHAAEAEAGPGR